jgi:hypothetical protein
MDVENRGVEDDAGRTDGDSGFTDDGVGLPEDTSEYVQHAAPEADLEDDFGDEDTVAPSGEAQSAAAQEPAAEEGTNLPDDVYEIDPAPHSLLSVLFPAKPPRPRNARIVRLFDIEAAKNDPQPGDAPVVEQPPKEEPRTREAIRAARNQSLLTAARLRY